MSQASLQWSRAWCYSESPALRVWILRQEETWQHGPVQKSPFTHTQDTLGHVVFFFFFIQQFDIFFFLSAQSFHRLHFWVFLHQFDISLYLMRPMFLSFCEPGLQCPEQGSRGSSSLLCAQGQGWHSLFSSSCSRTSGDRQITSHQHVHTPFLFLTEIKYRKRERDRERERERNIHLLGGMSKIG